jgi:hypothetical protein
MSAGHLLLIIAIAWVLFVPLADYYEGDRK